MTLRDNQKTAPRNQSACEPRGHKLIMSSLPAATSTLIVAAVLIQIVALHPTARERSTGEKRTRILTGLPTLFAGWQEATPRTCWCKSRWGVPLVCTFFCSSTPSVLRERCPSELGASSAEKPRS